MIVTLPNLPDGDSLEHNIFFGHLEKICGNIMMFLFISVITQISNFKPVVGNDREAYKKGLPRAVRAVITSPASSSSLMSARDTKAIMQSQRMPVRPAPVPP